uniref:Disease resistance R13L4/SHOC-2-like LRR domain-containing protein n=2 Tax=Oncorhynchus mykiss TaxID=8022 RepID=A0A8C7VT20_ONCMY
MILFLINIKCFLQEKSRLFLFSALKREINMRVDRTVDIPVYDISLLRNIWEGREKKYKNKQKKEHERVQKSALAKINQQWQYRIACKTLKSNEVEVLQHYLTRTALNEIQPHQDIPNTDANSIIEGIKFIFELDGDKWMELPDNLLDMTYLREWHIRRTKICKLPEWIVQFPDLCVLDIPQNGIDKLPVEIGQLTKLRVLKVNYNRLSSIPPELGECENLERLELTGNDLEQLPFELSNLKKVTHLDIAENQFASIPICALRMTSLQLLDMSINMLTDLPEDMDRLEELESLFVHKNNMSYLPKCLVNITTLKMIVVSGDTLICWPSGLKENPAIKFIKLYDNMVDEIMEGDDEILETRQDHHKEFMQTYIDTVKDRETAPTYTTKVSFSCCL